MKPSDSQQWGHPRGTLAIIVIFAILFTMGWLGFYFGLFLDRGLLQP